MNGGEPHRYLHPVTVLVTPEPAISTEPNAPIMPAWREVHVGQRDVKRSVMDAINNYRVEHYGDGPEYVVLEHPHVLALNHWGVDQVCGVRVLDERKLADGRDDPEPVDVAEYLTERLREDAA